MKTYFKKKTRRPRSIIDIAYDKNKVWWHQKIKRKRHGQLHHIFGRVGVEKCCPRFFVEGTIGHQDDTDWVMGLQYVFKKDYDLLTKGNYVREEGCKMAIFHECKFCAMPLLEDKREKKT